MPPGETIMPMLPIARTLRASTMVRWRVALIAKKPNQVLKQIEAPDPYRVNEEQGFVLYAPDAGKAVPDVDKNVLYLLYDGDVAEALQGPFAGKEDDGSYGQEQGYL